MGDAMSEDELREIEGREQKATEGPWATNVGCHCDYPHDRDICPDHYMGSVGAVNADELDNGKWVNGTRFDAVPLSEEDMHFIAHARTDVPRLTTEVRRLQRENDSLRKLVAVGERLIDEIVRQHEERGGDE